MKVTGVAVHPKNMISVRPSFGRAQINDKPAAGHIDKQYCHGYIVSNIKTTIDIPDSLLDQTRKLARQEHVTFRELVEEGLNLVVARHRQKKPIQVKPVTFKGKGLATELQQTPWAAIRDTIYEGRGA